MKTVDIIFRSISLIGFTANAASLCVPYVSGQRLVLKGVSVLCNTASASIVGFCTKDPMKHILPLICNCVAVLYGDFTSVGQMADPSTEHTPGRYFADAVSMGTQLTNILNGFEPGNKIGNPSDDGFDDDDDDDGGTPVIDDDFINKNKSKTKFAYVHN